MQLHLFSHPGEPFLYNILEAARLLLEYQDDPLVVYLPAANVHRHFVRETKDEFRGLARVSAIKPEVHQLEYIKDVLDQAALLYIPGGNTYLLAQRLHTIGLVEHLHQRIIDGLPLVAFSAGIVICGVDILTTNDMNCCGCTHFSGLNLLPYNINVHYPPEHETLRDERDARIQEYHVFHDTTVLALQDDAYLRVTNQGIELVSGTAWKLEKNRGKEPIPPGKIE
jgi:dipeptidase E